MTAVSDLEAVILRRAREASSLDIMDLLKQISATAPDKRNPYSTTVKIPWALVYAIRLKLGEGIQ